MQQMPHLRRAILRQRAFRIDRATQFHHFLSAVWATDTFPARLCPLFLQFFDLLGTGFHVQMLHIVMWWIYASRR